MKPKTVKQKLMGLIKGMANAAYLFAADYKRDFTRKRKLSMEKVILLLLGMGGKSLTNEMLEGFGYRPDGATASAFVQQRAKLKPEAMEFLFREFTDSCVKGGNLYKGFRLLAVDGSDVQLPVADPHDRDSFYPGANGQAPYNLLHLNALYDIQGHVYLDANIQKSRARNEHKALVTMVDRSPVSSAILLADRGFEGYNNMAHIQEKGWKYIIRVKDGTKGGILSGLVLPDKDEFDLQISLSLTRRQKNSTKELLKCRNQFKLINSHVPFDYLVLNETQDFYPLTFRVIRFKLSENTYEAVLTNLPSDTFPPDEIKTLYAMRWGIETSFRSLKYTVGLLHFHAKKVEYIFQEIFARLIMYNFSELITSNVVAQSSGKKHLLQVNFSAAAHICRQFFRGNVSPPLVLTLISRCLLPVRPGRSHPRNATCKPAVGFTYRLA